MHRPARRSAVHSGMYLNYGFFIYNAHSEKGAAPQLSTQVIMFHEGKPVFTGNQINEVYGTSRHETAGGRRDLQLGMIWHPATCSR
jgi:hypothetical protein